MFGKMIKKKKRTDNKCNKWEKNDIIIDPSETKNIKGEYHERLYSNKFENLDDIEKFLKNQNLPKLMQEWK